VTRGSRRGITFFVNGRPVADAALSAALIKAYHTLLMVGRYPLAVLFLEMSPDAVDVNVHPAKAEVRFREAERVFTGLQSAVRRALLAHSPVPDLHAQIRWTPPEAGFSTAGPSWGTPEHPAGSGSWDYPDNEGAPDRQETTTERSQTALPAGAIPLLRPVGQVASAYLVAEGPDGLYLIDQHAAHERVLFERFMAQRSEQIPSQALLQPESVELPPASARLLEDQLPVLSRLGFQVEDFGPNTFLVRAIPALLGGIAPVEAVRVLVEDFEEDETPLQAQIEARIIARVCKRAAIKAGQSLSPEEQRALIQDLEACQSPRTCPHGRPTMIHLSVDLLERQFGRRGAR
jgi:DNA mismatch repair protein MutL